MASTLQGGWKVFETEGDSSAIETVYIIADGKVSVNWAYLGEVANERNGQEIKYIRRGQKVNGGERRRNMGPTRTKIGK
jgi:hypothetical protein